MEWLLQIESRPDFIKGLLLGIVVMFLYRKIKRVFRAL